MSSYGKHGEWKSMYQCNSCKHISGWNYDRVCGGCGELKAKNNFEGYHGWTSVIVRWVDTSKWWNPYTWDRGYWEVKKD